MGEGSRVAESYTLWWGHSVVTSLTVGAAFPVRNNDKAGAGVGRRQLKRSKEMQYRKKGQHDGVMKP